MAKVYTDADRETMREMYNVEADQETRNNQVDAITKLFAADFGGDTSKARKSVIAVLSRMKIYKAVKKVSKVTGKKTQQKSDIVKSIAKVLNVEYVKIESLEKATKLSLSTLFDALKMSKVDGDKLAKDIIEHVEQAETMQETEAA